MPSALLIHGAWHGAWCWDGVIAELDRAGVTSNALELPHTGFGDDVAFAAAEIGRLTPGSVVLAHSYGGAVLTEAASGVPDLGRLVYLAALMTDAGEEVGATMLGSGGDLLEALELRADSVLVRPEAAPTLFYGDSDDDIAAAAVARLRPLGVDGSPLATRAPAWRTTPSTYVVCTNDAALPVALQRQMAERATETVEWACDHSPFLTRPADVAALVASFLG